MDSSALLLVLAEFYAISKNVESGNLSFGVGDDFLTYLTSTNGHRKEEFTRFSLCVKISVGCFVALMDYVSAFMHLASFYDHVLLLPKDLFQPLDDGKENKIKLSFFLSREYGQDASFVNMFFKCMRHILQELTRLVQMLEIMSVNCSFLVHLSLLGYFYGSLPRPPDGILLMKGY